MTSNPTKEGIRYTDEGMLLFKFVHWLPRRFLLEKLSEELEDTRNFYNLERVHFISRLYVVDKTEEVIRNLLETSQEGDSKAQ